MKYSISEKRRNFLKDKFFEYSFKEIDLDTKTLNSISEPIELDFISKNHNYDDGNEILFQIVNNPHCDFSTVKMIFFRSDLDGFINSRKDSIDESLIKSIIKNCEQNFYKEEKFYYNREDDNGVLEFDLDKGLSLFPSSLFGKAKGKKVEPNFAEKFSKRKISNSEIEIQNLNKTLKILSKNFTFEYSFPEGFEKIEKNELDNFIKNYKFPENLEINESQLKKAIIKPELTIKKNDLLIVLFVFDSKPLMLENSLTNVATILRNEFVYIQAFLQIIGVEENFEKIKRIKHNENWIALSKTMQIKIENIKNEKFLKLLLLEKSGLLFHFLIISSKTENLENETIKNLIINRITIK